MVKVLRSFVWGPLEPHVIGFAEELGRQGYSRTSAAQHVCFIAHLDRWMRAEGVGVDGLSGPVIERYLVQRRAAGYVEYRSVKALRPLLDYLAPLGVLPAAEEVPPGPVEELLGRYRDYLVVVRPFVVTRLSGEELHLVGLPGAGGRLGEAARVRAAVAAGLAVCDRAGADLAGECGAVGGRLAPVRPAEGPGTWPAAPAAGCV